MNKQGKRFLDETTDRLTMTAALMEQEDSLCFMISDANSVYVTEASPGEETLLAPGSAVQGRHARGSGEADGLDATAFTAEMERYNGFCETGEDEDFGRYLFSDLSPVKSFRSTPRPLPGPRISPSAAWMPTTGRSPCATRTASP